MKEVPLTKGLVALVDDADYVLVMQYNWSAKADLRKPNTTQYASRNVPSTPEHIRTTQKMHRFILGVTDPKTEVDHWDGDGLNNQRYNLRVATRSQNMSNTKKRNNNSSQYKGVSWHKDRKQWQAYISLNKKTTYLGLHSSEELAALAYDAKAKEYFGEFAYLNFPEASSERKPMRLSTGGAFSGQVEIEKSTVHVKVI